MKKQLFLATILAALALAPHTANAKKSWVTRIPHGARFSCSGCHGSGKRLNAFGRDFDRTGKRWGPALAARDSDGDGVSNGEELQDPQGRWAPGAPDPGLGSRVASPASSTSRPPLMGSRSPENAKDAAPAPVEPAPETAGSSGLPEALRSLGLIGMAGELQPSPEQLVAQWEHALEAARRDGATAEDLRTAALTRYLLMSRLIDALETGDLTSRQRDQLLERLGNAPRPPHILEARRREAQDSERERVDEALATPADGLRDLAGREVAGGSLDPIPPSAEAVTDLATETVEHVVYTSLAVWKANDAAGGVASSDEVRRAAAGHESFLEDPWTGDPLRIENEGGGRLAVASKGPAAGPGGTAPAHRLRFDRLGVSKAANPL